MATEAQTCAYGIEHPESRLVLSEVEGIEYPASSIVNPTLAHFRHFSSLYTNEYRVSSIRHWASCGVNPTLA
ncbi:unnamed protein product, partial [marine sediment metagenome]